MGEKTTVTVTCDVCGREMWSGCPKSKDRPIARNVLVWFDTEQTEGRSTEPYLSSESVFLCDECAEKGIRIHGSGAMGCNEYRIKEAGR